MTLPERLRAAASAERLSDWVRVSRTGCIYLREDEAGAQPFLFQVERRRYREDGRWVPRWHYGQNGRWEFDPRPTREAAIRAGLLALAEREEARHSQPFGNPENFETAGETAERKDP